MFSVENMTNEFPEELVTRWDSCTVSICSPDMKDELKVRSGEAVVACAGHIWGRY